MNTRFFFVAAIIISILAVSLLGLTFTGFFGSTSEQGTIKIGAILPLTGSNARYGELEKTGLEIALREINNAGGINGKELEIVFEDSQGDAKHAINSWRKIMTDQKVPLILSGLSSVCMALRPIANSDGTVLLATDCSAAQYSSANDFSFRITNSNAEEGKKMAQLMLSKGISSVAVLKINNDYGEGLFPSFEKEFSQGNGKIFVLQAYDSKQRDFFSELAKIKESDPQAVYLVSYAPDAEIIVKQMKELGIDLPVFAAEPIENNDFLKNAGDAAEGIVYIKAALVGQKGTEFAQKAEAELGRYPEINIARTYDSLHVAAEAIRICDSENNLTGECVKEQFYQAGFEGVLGKISFDANGDVSIPYAKKIIKNGQFTVCGEEC